MTRATVRLQRPPSLSHLLCALAISHAYLCLSACIITRSRRPTKKMSSGKNGIATEKLIVKYTEITAFGLFATKYEHNSNRWPFFNFVFVISSVIRVADPYIVYPFYGFSLFLRWVLKRCDVRSSRTNYYHYRSHYQSSPRIQAFSRTNRWWSTPDDTKLPLYSMQTFSTYDCRLWQQKYRPPLILAPFQFDAVPYNPHIVCNPTIKILSGVFFSLEEHFREAIFACETCSNLYQFSFLWSWLSS